MTSQPQGSPAEQSPDHIVAKRIADELLAAGLIPKSKLGECEKRLAVGMKEVEWKLLLDLALEDGEEGN